MLLHQLECFLYKVADIVCILLRVVNLVTQVLVPVAHQIQNWQNLTVVGHQSLSNGIT